MSAAVDALAAWLADVHLLGAALLAAVLAALALLRQPAQRMAIEKSTLGALAALTALCALPGWSLVHLLSEETPASPTMAASSTTSAAEPFTPPVVAYDPKLDAMFAPVVPTAAETASAMTPLPPTTAANPRPDVPWITLLVAAQLAGSAAVVAWLAIGAVVARRVRRDTRLASPELARKLQAIAEIRISLRPELLISDHVGTPLALGLRKPAIILPARFVEPAAADEDAARDLAAILAHEWAHVAAGDLRTLAVSRLLLVLLWPQPLFWLLRRRLRLDQETLADAAAAEVAGRIDYAQQLLAWSREVGPRGRAPRLAGAVGLWEGPSQLKRRIAALLDEKLTVLRQASRSWRTGTACAALAAAALLSLVTVQRQEAAAQAARSGDAVASGEDDGAAADDHSEMPAASGAPSPAEFDLRGATIDDLQSHAMLVMQGYRIFRESAPNVFAGRCVDENGRPLAGAKVSLLRGPFWSSAPEVLGTATSNDRGEFYFRSVLDIAKEYPDGQIPTTAHPGEPMVYCVAQLEGRASRLAMISQYVVPSVGRSIEFVMSPAVALRGRVTDERGQSIAGARVTKTADGGKVPGMWSAETNANGEYEIADLPPFDFAAERRRQLEEEEQSRAQALAGGQGFFLSTGSMAPQFLVTHRDYAYKRIQPVELPGVGDVRLERGGGIAGRVVSPDGQPAANVEVRAYRSVPRRPNDAGIAMFNHGAVTLDDLYYASQRTDADGRYEFGSLRPGAYDVWAESPGWFNLGHGEVAAEAGKVAQVEDLRLSRGGTVQVTFVDEATGKPIAPEPGLFADIGLYYDNKLSRQEDWPPRATIGPDGVARVEARPGRARVIVSQPLSTSQAPKWTVVGGENFLQAPIVEIREGETIEVRLNVVQAPVQALPGGLIVKPAYTDAFLDTSGQDAAASTASTLDATRSAPPFSDTGLLARMETSVTAPSLALTDPTDGQLGFSSSPLRNDTQEGQDSTDDTWRVGRNTAAVVGAPGDAVLMSGTSPDEEGAIRYPPNTLVASYQADGESSQASEGEPAAAGAATPGAGTTHAATGGIAQVVQFDADGVVSFPVPGQAADATPNTITVRCLDDAGAALPDATVSLYRIQHRTGTHELVREVKTNAAGEARFDNLFTTEQAASYAQRGKNREFDDDLYARGFMLVARKPDLATTMFGTSELEAAVRGYRADVKLPKAQRLAGRVTAPDGSPVANALVAAGGNAASIVIEGINAVRTDAEGRYEFTDRQPLNGEAARKQRMQLDFYALAAAGVAEQPDRPAVGQDRDASRLIVSHPDYAVTRVDAGDIPGTADVTMLPAAAIEGRVVEHGTGAPVADTLVRAYALPDLKLDADSRTIRTINTLTALAEGSHTAATRTDAAGRYRFSNMPAGVYDVWAEPQKPADAAAPRFNRGHSAMVVAPGAEPVAAPDLVVGPGALVRVQLVDVATNQPVKLNGGGRVLVAPQNVGGPRMQYEASPEADVSPGGKFEVRMRPGTFRIAMFVYQGDKGPGSEPLYITPDDIHSVGETIEAKHGDTIDMELNVWPMVKVAALRAAFSAAYKLRSERPDDRAALEQVIAIFTTSLEEFPNNHGALIGRGSVQERLGNYGEAIADFQRALETYPGDVGALMYLANLLATCPDDEFRDGPRAVELATQLVNVVRERGQLQDKSRFLTILAAAQAEAGDFAAAVATQKEAIAAADDERRAELEERLKLFEAGKPYHREAPKLE